MSIQDVLSRLQNGTDKICNSCLRSLQITFAKCLPETENRPTFHEIRSLSARLYEEEKGAEFAKKLLGHKSISMTDKYLDSRNNEYIKL